MLDGEWALQLRTAAEIILQCSCEQVSGSKQEMPLGTAVGDHNVPSAMSFEKFESFVRWTAVPMTLATSDADLQCIREGHFLFDSQGNAVRVSVSLRKWHCCSDLCG